jgi:hypothetical protein
VATRDFRIKVRGVFEQLSDEQRAELLAAASVHDLFGAEFTREGHLSYDLAPGRSSPSGSPTPGRATRTWSRRPNGPRRPRAPGWTGAGWGSG